jgi:aspartate 1-decarboxylase
MREFLRSKIHKAKITIADTNYVGSIGIDKDLVEKAGFKNGEKVLVADNSNGQRLETYIIEEEAGSGKIAMYGAAARIMKKGDEVIIMGFELSEDLVKPKIILLDDDNKFLKYL